jgi:hypothetical protein
MTATPGSQDRQPDHRCTRSQATLKQTQSFLGHSGIRIASDVYIHLQPDSEVESMDKLEEAFFGELCQLCSAQRF